jgi:SnoaL-like domain
MAGDQLAELQALLDKQQISELVYTYSRAVDRKDFALLRTLYTEDGFDDHGGLYRGPAAGYVDWLEQAMGNCDITTHSVNNHLIALAGPNRAQGEVYVTAYHRLGDGSGGYGELIEGLRYLDDYEKRNGVWQFARRTLINDWAQMGVANWDIEHPALQGTPVGRGDADDPSYRHLSHPLFGRREC